MAKFDLSSLPPRPDFSFEASLWQQGCLQVAGIDEAGRGAWAGPVSAAVVIFPPQLNLYDALTGVRDSKQMSPAERLRWADAVRSLASAWSVGFASSAEIDTAGILPATRLAVQRALEQIPAPPQHLLVDYLVLPAVCLPQTPLVKGDARSLSIAAASILAKTARDARLVELEAEYPGYSFGRHKGYGTAAHQAALQRLGPCPQHRASFRPVVWAARMMHQGQV